MDGANFIEKLEAPGGFLWALRQMAEGKTLFRQSDALDPVSERNHAIYSAAAITIGARTVHTFIRWYKNNPTIRTEVDFYADDVGATDWACVETEGGAE